MSVKQRLEYGIYPIASRRHQPHDNWGSFQRFPHTYVRNEALAIIWAWTLILPISVVLAIFGVPFGTALATILFWVIVFTVSIARS